MSIQSHASDRSHVLVLFASCFLQTLHRAFPDFHAPFRSEESLVHDFHPHGLRKLVSPLTREQDVWRLIHHPTRRGNRMTNRANPRHTSPSAHFPLRKAAHRVSAKHGVRHSAPGGPLPTGAMVREVCA